MQERAFGQYGVHAAEVIFAQHAIGLPLFASAADLPVFLAHWGRAETVAILGVAVPIMYALIAAEVILSHLLKLSSTWLVGITDALTSTLVSALQRVLMVPLVASLFATKTLPPTFWLGVALVAGGCVGHALSKGRDDKG